MVEPCTTIEASPYVKEFGSFRRVKVYSRLYTKVDEYPLNKLKIISERTVFV